MNALAFSTAGEVSVKQRAYDLIRTWHNDGFIPRTIYRQAEALAERCAEELGDDMPDNDMSHGYISAWLRKEMDRE